MNAALGEASIDLEPDRSRQFSLLLIEAVKVFCSEFESCGDMEQVSGLCGLIEGSLVLLDVRDHVRRPPLLHPVMDSLGYAPLARHLGT